MILTLPTFSFYTKMTKNLSFTQVFDFLSIHPLKILQFSMLNNKSRYIIRQQKDKNIDLNSKTFKTGQIDANK